MIMENTYRCHKRTADESNHAPIEGQDAHAQASVRAEQCVDNDVVGSDPTDPVEHAECGEKVSRDPVPYKAAGEGDDEEALAGHMVGFALAIIFVQGVEKSGVDQGARPDHTRWPDDKLPQHATESKAENLGAEGKEHLEAHGRRSLVEDARREDDLGGVSTANGNAGHDRDADVLLDGEGARVERPDVTESFEAASGEDGSKRTTARKRNQLGNNAREVDRRI